MSEPRCKMSQEVWIDVDPITKEHDCEIHIKGKDIFEVLEGISKVRDQIQRDNFLNWSDST